MNHRDLATLTRAFAPILREFVDGAVGPLVKRLDALEAGRGEDGLALADLRREIEGVGPKLESSIIAVLPKAPTSEEVAALVPAGKDGAPGADGRDGTDGKDGADGKDGRDGIDGKDGLAGKDGRDGADGSPGRDGVNGEKGEPGKDGIGLADALIDRDGGLVVTTTDGKAVSLGIVVGKDGEPGKPGADGLGFDDLDVVDDGMTFTLRFARGEQIKEFRLAKPTLADMHRGVWKEGAYARGSVVTWGGSLWMAKVDTDAKPESNDDWLLVTKRGRDGKDGELKAPREPATVKLR